MAQLADVEMAQPPAAAEPKQPNHYWAKILALFCSASTIEIALLSTESGAELPAIFYFLGFTLILGFTCFFVGRCIRSMFRQAAEVLQGVGIFFGVTAIFISITIPFPALWFKCVTGFIYALCWLTILACNYFDSHLRPVYNNLYDKVTTMSSGLLSKLRQINLPRRRGGEEGGEGERDTYSSETGDGEKVRNGADIGWVVGCCVCESGLRESPTPASVVGKEYSQNRYKPKSSVGLEPYPYVAGSAPDRPATV